MTDWHLPTGFCALTPRARLTRRLEVRHYACLQYAIEQPGMTATEMSRATGMALNSVVALLNSMHWNGLIECSASTTGKNRSEVRATSNGRTQFNIALKAMKRMCEWHDRKEPPAAVPLLRQKKQTRT